MKSRVIGFVAIVSLLAVWNLGANSSRSADLYLDHGCYEDFAPVPCHTPAACLGTGTYYCDDPVQDRFCFADENYDCVGERQSATTCGFKLQCGTGAFLGICRQVSACLDRSNDPFPP